MRILFSFTITFLFTVLAAGLCSAHMTDPSCHEDKQVSGAIDMAQCSCSHETRIVNADLGSDVVGGTDCCLSDACSRLSYLKTVALGTTVISTDFSGILQDPSFFQPNPLAILGALRTGLPPPRLQSTPVYIKNCSFLI